MAMAMARLSALLAAPGCLLALLLLGPAVAAATTTGQAPLDDVLGSVRDEPAYRYPTDLTRGIQPIICHSHNDYWRDVPFFTALRAGCISTEADVWLLDDTLYVGHHMSSLTEERTLESLYIKPILKVLRRQNPKSRFISAETKNGVFDTEPSQTLYLFIDMKTPGDKTFDAVHAALEPLRSAGFLTTVTDNATVAARPITVIGTGDTPLQRVAAQRRRDIFFDAPAATLGDTELTDKISPIASASLRRAILGEPLYDYPRDAAFSEPQRKRIQEQIATAAQRGIGVRYWGTPDWPVRKRNAVWRALVEDGVALLNTDDVEAVRSVFWVRPGVRPGVRAGG
ncbi:hypothetical protein KEM52_003904 [Ascosphaera acerosa]|nr:hypothetical protein KEM52_003904 [Ascosphaera acerosa]